ncbi:hypothetical protein AAEO57_20650 [Flavobacterium sp. DGU38]|uniref:Lipoprotein n=1 Tax=Flavobacterium calami TaxID=3139144 RepID=A0ABU9IX25_9FLAO
MKLKIIYLFVFLTLVSCKKDQNENTIDENFCREQLEILIDESRIKIDIESNIGRIETEKIINKKPVIENKSFKLTEVEKQKLFSNAYKLITLKEYTIQTKTCNAGENFILRLVCNNKVLEFHQSSVVSWSRISKETTEIYSILKGKTDLKE